MRLLIVDDEQLTREGLHKQIDWKALGITEVVEAENGYKGIQTAVKLEPEIILTDIRMPVVSGIDLAEKIQEMYSETCVIFMSGYSDREYLKAAIKLGVIGYVEKPIIPEEIEAAVREAVICIKTMQRTKSLDRYHFREGAEKLALSILYEKACRKDEFKELIKTLNFGEHINAFYRTVVIEFLSETFVKCSNKIIEIMQGFIKTASAQSYRVIYGIKDDYHLVIHLYRNRVFNERFDEYLYNYLREKLACYGSFFIAEGNEVKGIESVYQSYNASTGLLQSGFFCEENTILRQHEVSNKINQVGNRLDIWKEGIQKRDKEKCFELIEKLYLELYCSRDLLKSQAKDIYYSYFMQMDCLEENVTIWSMIEQCKTLKELSEMLKAQLQGFYDAYEQEREDNEVVFEIKDFIRKNYAVETLSVKDISDHIYRSPSSASSLFKHETSMTLNQYITKYRLSRAKDMLADLRFKISDVAAAVGYNDGKYFTKTFKKNVGMLPSEYREKVKTGSSLQ